MRIISISNHKGGTGKTTTTLNLGKALALKGKKVLVIDLDPQANLSQSLGIEAPSPTVYDAMIDDIELPYILTDIGLYLCPADLFLSKAEANLYAEPDGYFKVKTSIQKLTQTSVNFDFILLDCPPSLGILTSNAFIASDYVLIPVQSQFLATKGLETILEVVKKISNSINPNLKLLGLLLTQTNRTVLSQNVIELIHKNYGNQVFETVIRQNVALAEASVKALSIFDYAPTSHGAMDYQGLGEEVLQRI